MPEAEARRPDPSISLILRPKWLTARARALANERGRGARFFLLSLIGMLFWVFIYTLLYKLLVYFRGVPDLGPFLAGKLLGNDPDRVLLHPAAVERHHRAVELLPRA
jgi:hypothetical protein